MTEERTSDPSAPRSAGGGSGAEPEGPPARDDGTPAPAAVPSAAPPDQDPRAETPVGEEARPSEDVPPAVPLSDYATPSAGGESLLDRLGRRPALLVAVVLGPVVGIVLALVLGAGTGPKPPADVPRAAEASSAALDGGADADSSGIPESYVPRFRVADLASDESVKVVEQKVGHQTFLVALRRAGVGAKGAQRILEAFKGVRSFDRLHEKDLFRVALTKDGNVVKAFEYETSPGDVWQVREKDGAFVGEKLALTVEKRRTAKALLVKDDLKTAATEAGIDHALLDRIEDGLEGHVDAAAVRPGSRLRLLIVETVIDGKVTGKADLDALEYLGPKANATALRYYRSPAKGGSFYDGKGQQPYSGGYRSPVPFAHITSRFNPHRMHPVLHIVKPHNGVDYAASVGTPVYAVAPGTIKFAADSGPCGNMVQIQHPNGLITAYCHLSRFGKVHVGQHVEGRQLIGYAGQTGRATGPHLHFAVKKGDTFIDPATLKMDGIRSVPANEREAFEANRAAWNAELDAIPLPALPTELGGTKEEDADEVLGDDDEADAGPPPP